MTHSNSEPSRRGRARRASPTRSRGPRLRECSVELEIPFHDVDALRMVWHGHYYKYLELARTQLLRECRLDAPDLLGMHYGLLVIESGCRYVSPLRYADRVRVTAWLRDVTHRIYIAYEITNLTQQARAARSHTILVTTDGDGQMLHRTPEALLKRLLPDGTRTQTEATHP
jgi:acyl-CoA thioester hydrolase